MGKLHEKLGNGACTRQRDYFGTSLPDEHTQHQFSPNQRSRPQSGHACSWHMTTANLLTCAKIPTYGTEMDSVMQNTLGVGRAPTVPFFLPIVSIYYSIPTLML